MLMQDIQVKDAADVDILKEGIENRKVIFDVRNVASD